jgi:EAL domain-containing protein (putative c-di-GMP-specific phosphodiesterase class I)
MGVDVHLSINLSAQNINNLALPEKLETLLKNHAIASETFVLNGLMRFAPQFAL